MSLHSAEGWVWCEHDDTVRNPDLDFIMGGGYVHHCQYQYTRDGCPGPHHPLLVDRPDPALLIDIFRPGPPRHEDTT